MCLSFGVWPDPVGDDDVAASDRNRIRGRRIAHREARLSHAVAVVDFNPETIPTSAGFIVVLDVCHEPVIAYWVGPACDFLSALLSPLLMIMPPA